MTVLVTLKNPVSWRIELVTVDRHRRRRRGDDDAVCDGSYVGGSHTHEGSVRLGGAVNEAGSSTTCTRAEEDGADRRRCTGGER